MAAYTTEVDASCAICGAPPYPECPHEGQRLEIALNQAMQKWLGYQEIREWVVNHARDQVLETFREMRAVRMEQHYIYMQTLPYHTLYHKYDGRPPLAPDQIQQYHVERHRAETVLKQRVDQDWKSSCLRYPEILDYYFSVVNFSFPSERDPSILDPRFGPGEKGRPRQEVRRRRSGDRSEYRRRSRERGLPEVPAAPRYR